MPTEYKITYTYTGQGNTSGTRSVSIGRFKKTGDTGRTIAQITSIKYEHWHTSTKPMTWNLRGRLVFSDGTMITSPNVGHKISGDVVKYTHTFTTMPTAEQWSKLSRVQTLDSNGSTGDSGYSADLFWRADSIHPMRITVTFIEEPPVVFDPQIKTFKIKRCDAKGNTDDEGNRVSTSLQIGIGNKAGLDGALLRVYYEPDDRPIIGVSEYVDLTPRITELLNGVENDIDIISDEFDAGHSWTFAVVFIAGNESDEDVETIAHKMCGFHIAANRGGACVCGFANGTASNPMFESHATGYFYKGIHGVTNYIADEVETGGSWIDGNPIFRKVIEFGAVATGGSIEIVLGIENAVALISMNLIGYSPDKNTWYPVPYAASSTDNHLVTRVLNWNTTPTLRVSAQSGAGALGGGFAIIEYTKPKPVEEDESE